MLDGKHGALRVLHIDFGARSNSATAAMIPNVIRPAGVVMTVARQPSTEEINRDGNGDVLVGVDADDDRGRR